MSFSDILCNTSGLGSYSSHSVCGANLVRVFSPRLPAISQPVASCQVQTHKLTNGNPIQHLGGPESTQLHNSSPARTNSSASLYSIFRTRSSSSKKRTTSIEPQGSSSAHRQPHQPIDRGRSFLSHRPFQRLVGPPGPLSITPAGPHVHAYS